VEAAGGSGKYFSPRGKRKWDDTDFVFASYSRPRKSARGRIRRGGGGADVHLANIFEECWKVLSKHPNAAAFRNPVPPKLAPDYATVITNPIDLGAICKKIRDLQYKSKTALLADFELMHRNCEIYNTGKHAASTPELVSYSKQLVEEMEKELNKKADEIKELEEAIAQSEPGSLRESMKSEDSQDSTRYSEASEQIFDERSLDSTLNNLSNDTYDTPPNTTTTTTIEVMNTDANGREVLDDSGMPDLFNI